MYGISKNSAYNWPLTHEHRNIHINSFGNTDLLIYLFIIAGNCKKLLNLEILKKFVNFEKKKSETWKI